MCVTSNPATINGTRTYVHATDLGDGPVHVCGYQNMAESLGGGNCMFLNFAGTDLSLVRGPEHTNSFMRDMTLSLRELIPVRRTRGGGAMRSFGSPKVVVEEYGDYTVILAQQADDILSALDQVPTDRRPRHTPRLQAMVDFYMSLYPQDSFVLACFNGAVRPKHPITVAYRPLNANVMTIPGLDGHDGKPPTVGAPVYRDFRVAFGMSGLILPHQVRYFDQSVAGMPWAPESVAGFVDNRRNGPNGDYVVPVESLREGLTGKELADKLL